MGARASSRTVALALVAVVLVAAAAPVWLTRRFPSQDGPAHLGAAAAIAGYPAALQPALERYVEVRLTPDRSPLGHLVLAGLVRVAGPRPAERLFVTAMLVLFVAAAWYAASAVRRDGGGAALLLVPVATGRLFHLGFWDFLLGVGGLLVVAGFWLRRPTPSAGDVTALGGLLLISAALHPSVAPPAVAAVGLVTLLRGGGAVRRTAAVVVAALPALALAASVAAQERLTDPAPALSRSLHDLATFTVLRATRGGLELVLVAAVVVALGGAVAAGGPTLVRRLARRSPEPADGFLALAVMALGAALFGPRTAAGAGFVGARMVAYAYVLTVLWAAAQPRPGRRCAAPALAVVAVALVATVAVRLPAYGDFDRYLAEVASLEPAMVPGRTVVAVLARENAVRPTRRLLFNPLKHVGGMLAAERHLVDLGNYEGTCDYFPFAYRTARDPLVHLFVPGGQKCPVSPPAVVDPGRYMTRTDGRLDYVVVVGRPSRALRDALDRLYRRVRVTRPTGLASLWQLRPEH